MESATAAAPPTVGPAARPVHLRAWAWLRRNAVMIYAGFAIAYMLIPIVVIAVFSFGETPRGTLNFTLDGGFTTEYWSNAFSVEELNTSMLTSLRLAGLSTLISTVIGTLMAMALVRYQFSGRKASNLLIVLPMASPEIVLGASLLSLFIVYDIARGFNTLLIAHVMFSISFVVVVVRSRLIGFDRSLEEAAADLGAPPLATFRYVTLPLLAPGIMAAALLAFALSIDDFVISNFNAGATETFPLWVYAVAQRGIPVQVNVVATMLFAVTVAAIALVLWQQRRAERMAAKLPEPAPAPTPAPAARPSSA
jgi:spermidine/putrescine transport system permease protein